MDNIKVAKDLLKIANELFEVEEYQETEHDKIKKLLTQYGKKFKNDFITL
jgi:hypothetical protein